MWCVFDATKLFDAVDGEDVGARAFDARAHLAEHTTQVLHVRLRSGVANDRRAFGGDGRQHGVLRGGHGGLVEQYIGAAQPFGGHQQPAVVADVGAQLRQRQQVGINAPATDLVAARPGQLHAPSAGQHRAHQHQRPANVAEQVGVGTGLANGIRAERHRVGVVTCHLDAQVFHDG